LDAQDRPASQRGETTMLWQRVATALVGLPIFLYALVAGGIPLVVLTVVLALVATSEFCRLLEHAQVSVDQPLLYLAALVLPVLGYGAGLTAVLAAIPAAFLLCVFLIVVRVLAWGGGRHDTLAARTAWTVTGVVYIAGLWSLLPLLRIVGLVWVIASIVITWLTDTGAYFTGRALGGPKFIPFISPNKTWSGVIGGMVLGAVGVLVLSLFYPFTGVGVALSLGLAGAIAAHVGDLWVSLLKRFSGVKDAGSILPGHGGILDRFDSYLFVLPVVYVTAQLLHVV